MKVTVKQLLNDGWITTIAIQGRSVRLVHRSEFHLVWHLCKLKSWHVMWTEIENKWHFKIEVAFQITTSAVELCPTVPRGVVALSPSTRDKKANTVASLYFPCCPLCGNWMDCRVLHIPPGQNRLSSPLLFRLGEFIGMFLCSVCCCAEIIKLLRLQYICFEYGD